MVLLYMNPTWESAGGRLRLLKSANDNDDMILEVPPVEGTLLAFNVAITRGMATSPLLASGG